VIGNDFDSVQKAFEIMAKLLEGCKDSEEFFVVDIIVKLSRSHGTRVEGDGMQERVRGIDLRENRSDCIVRGIGLYDRDVIWIEVCEDGGRREMGFENVEGLLAGRRPNKRHFLAGEGSERLRD
jgi:hypothetical protein